MTRQDKKQHEFDPSFSGPTPDLFAMATNSEMNSDVTVKLKTIGSIIFQNALRVKFITERDFETLSFLVVNNPLRSETEGPSCSDSSDLNIEEGSEGIDSSSETEYSPSLNNRSDNNLESSRGDSQAKDVCYSEDISNHHKPSFYERMEQFLSAKISMRSVAIDSAPAGPLQNEKSEPIDDEANNEEITTRSSRLELLTF
jgi:hypothetical protein